MFQYPQWARISFSFKAVGFVAGEGSVTVDGKIACEATATDEFKRIGGVMRRRFVDCVPSIIPGRSDVWLSDEELDATDANAPPSAGGRESAGETEPL